MVDNCGNQSMMKQTGNKGKRGWRVVKSKELEKNDN